MYISRLIDALILLKKYSLYAIAPPVCAYCKTFLSEYVVLCSTCKSEIAPLVSVIIPVTKKYHMSVMCVGEYKDPLKKLILSKGWSDYVASHELGQLMYELTPIENWQCDLIVPIPLHWRRYAWRGYNQAEEMAKALSTTLDIPYANLLKRVRATPLQSSVEHTEREGNVKNVFALNRVDIKKFKHKRILIIDDLMTTGATLQSAAKIISRHLRPLALHAVVSARVK